MKPNRDRFLTFVSEMSYQTSSGIQLYGSCSMPGCDSPARGSAHCSHCIEEKMAKEIGPDMAKRLHHLHLARKNIQARIDEIIIEAGK